MASEMDESLGPGAGGDGPSSWTNASLRRTNEEMREHIMRLKAEAETERNNVKRLEREKVTSVKRARDEETARSKQVAEELKQKTSREHKEQLQTLQEACAREYETEARRVVRECEDKIRTQKQQWEREKSEELDNVRKSTSRKVREEAHQQFDQEKKKLQQEVFELSDAKTRAEQRMKELQVADKSKADDIRRMHEEHQTEMAKMKRASQQENRKMRDELLEKQEALSRKEKELVDAKRKKSQVQMEKETLEENLSRVKEADSWARMSPRAAIAGIGDISFDSATSPMQKKQYGEREKQLIQRNSELSILARRLEEGLSSMTTEKKGLEKQLLEAGLSNEPLEEKSKDLMKKYNALIAKHRRLEDQNKQNSENYKSLKSKHDTLLQDFDALTTKTRKFTGQSRLSEQQKEELESLRHQYREHLRTIADLKQNMTDKDRRLKQALSSKRSLVKKQQELEASLAAATTRASRSSSGMSGSQSFSGIPSPSKESNPIVPAATQSQGQGLALMSRSSSLESLASALQDEADQAAFERDELEADFSQLEKEHMHLRRVFALHFQHSLSDKEREEYEELMADYQQQQEAISALRQAVQTAEDRAIQLQEDLGSAQEELRQSVETHQMGGEEIATLSATCTELMEAKATLSEGLETAWKAVEEADAKTQQLETDLLEARQQIESLQETLKMKEHAMTRQEAAKDDALQTSLDELQTSEDKSTQLNSAVAELKEEVEERDRQVQDLLQELEVSESDKRKAQKQVLGLQAKLHDAQVAGGRENAEMLEQLQKHFEQKERSLTRDVEQASRDVLKLLAQLESAQSDKKDVERKAKVHEAELTEQLQKHLEQTERAFTQDVEQANRDVQQMKAQLQSVESDKKAVERRAKVHEAELAALRAASNEHRQASHKLESISSLVSMDLMPQVEALLRERVGIMDVMMQLCHASVENDTVGVKRGITTLQELLTPGLPLEHLSAVLTSLETCTGTPLGAIKQRLSAAKEKQIMASKVPSLPSPSPPSPGLGSAGIGGAQGSMAVDVLQEMLKTRNDEVEDLQLQLRSRNEEHLAAVQELEENQQEVAIMKAQCQRLTSRLEMSQSESTSLQTAAMKLEALERIHEGLKQDYANVKTKAERAARSGSGSSSKEATQLTQELETSKVVIEHLTRQKDSLAKTNEALNSELLLLWRLVSLELKYTANVEGSGEQGMETRLRELETALQTHKGVEVTVARIMEARGRNAVSSDDLTSATSDGGSFQVSDTSINSMSTTVSLKEKVGELSDECKDKEDKILQLEAEIARLTTKLSCNILMNMSADHSSMLLDSSSCSSPGVQQQPRKSSRRSTVDTPLLRDRPSSTTPATVAEQRRRLTGSDVEESELPNLRSPSASTRGAAQASERPALNTGTRHRPAGAVHTPLAGGSRSMSHSAVLGHATPARTATHRGHLAHRSVSSLQHRPQSPAHSVASSTHSGVSSSSQDLLSPRGRHAGRGQQATPVMQQATKSALIDGGSGGSNHQLYIALDDFNPTEQYPDGLSLLAGTIVQVTGVDLTNGAYTVEYEGVHGRLPVALLEKLSPGMSLYSHGQPFHSTTDHQQLAFSGHQYHPSEFAPSQRLDQHRLSADQDITGHRSLTASPQPSISSLSRVSPRSAGVKSPPIYLGSQPDAPIPAPPTDLRVDRKLEDNLLVAWTCPPLDQGVFSNGAEVIGYRISVDDEITEDLSGAERQKVLLERIDLSRPHILSVATISSTGAFSQFARIRVTTRPTPDGDVLHGSSTNIMPAPPRHAPPTPQQQQRVVNGLMSPASASPGQHLQGAAAYSPVGSALSLHDLQPGLAKKLQHNTATDGPYLAIALKTFTPSARESSSMLALNEGDMMQVVSNDPKHPWLVAKRNNQQGKVRRDIVERLPNIVASQQEFDSIVNNLQSNSLPQVHTVPHPQPPHPQPRGIRAAIALYTYEPSLMSPRETQHRGQLSFQEGDTMWIKGGEDESGFLLAELNGYQGLVPATFVDFVDATPEDQLVVENVAEGLETDGMANRTLSEESMGSVSSIESSDLLILTSDGRLHGVQSAAETTQLQPHHGPAHASRALRNPSPMDVPIQRSSASAVQDDSESWATISHQGDAPDHAAMSSAHTARSQSTSSRQSQKAKKASGGSIFNRLKNRKSSESVSASASATQQRQSSSASKSIHKRRQKP
eukprot:scpid4164/ scgid20722/ Janus kinase and microtubule-interacting protein 3; Neuroendocrine long coiled-coil protein 2